MAQTLYSLFPSVWSHGALAPPSSSVDDDDDDDDHTPIQPDDDDGMPMHMYPVIVPGTSMSVDVSNHRWARNTPHSAIGLMSDLLETLTSQLLLDSTVLMAQFKPFVKDHSVSNTEFEYLFRKVHAVWERTEEHICTHQLDQFYGLVVGDASTRVPYIATIRGIRVSWFVNRPGTDEWTSVRHNMRTPPDDAERFARSFLYPTHLTASDSPNVNPQPRPVALRTANRSDLDNIINAGNVLGPRHKTTKRIVRQWIMDLVRQHPMNGRGGSDRLETVFDQIDFMPTL